ncbi:hypothetical protein Tco_0651519 [Tanacetum coccineum]|uniref:Uncharacterized protein n=1 Tax=Tanacetum coccineum TaxID=301880 RepID=A0ABQ4WV57_9ASTR
MARLRLDFEAAEREVGRLRKQVEELKVEAGKSKTNGKLLVNSILHGSYVRRMIVEPGDPNCTPPVAESTHEQTDDELTEKEAKQIEADDQAI